MGSRAKRARAGISIKVAAENQPKTLSQLDNGTRPIPTLTHLDVVFGNIKHLPAYTAIPERFSRQSDPYVRFVSGWFFGGRTKDDMQRLTARHGVDRGKALAAVQAILGSFEPKREHKEAGCAFLLCEWFELS